MKINCYLYLLTTYKPWTYDLYNNTNNITLTPHVGVAARGNKYKLYQSSVEYDLKKHFFTIIVVS